MKKQFLLWSLRIVSLFVACGVLAIVAISGSMIARAMADKPDKSDGTPRVGDRVIYFSDFDGDGLFERNVAFVIDDVVATAELDGALLPGQRVNLYVLSTAGVVVDGKFIPSPFPARVVRSVARGRAVGEYESLSTSNH